MAARRTEILLVLGAMWLGAKPVRGSTAQMCPEYVTHLTRAQDLLSRGDRGGALVELREARTALTDCARRAEEEGTVVLSHFFIDAPRSSLVLRTPSQLTG